MTNMQNITNLAFAKNAKDQIETRITNVLTAIRSPEFCGMQFQRGEEVECAPVDSDTWRNMRDSDITELRITLESKGFKRVGKRMVIRAVKLVALENTDGKVWG
ncbi:hypothetical protein GM31_09210 [Trabulsiella odontotermitis]|uniref:Uncharacterized protein n=1 Tax=Trabulsiella odontotermitis TaxID=379893 RepID=A0A0L0GJL9_9ENTR|nr:hypothetical protein GM31_09210 [Trabulsiella odontotermitis]